LFAIRKDTHVNEGLLPTKGVPKRDLSIYLEIPENPALYSSVERI